jgi:hypothetical protein
MRIIFESDERSPQSQTYPQSPSTTTALGAIDAGAPSEHVHQSIAASTGQSYTIPAPLGSASAQSSGPAIDAGSPSPALVAAIQAASAAQTPYPLADDAKAAGAGYPLSAPLTGINAGPAPGGVALGPN